MPDRDYYFIQSSLHGAPRVLDLAGGATARGTAVVLAPRATGAAAESQLWQLTPDGYLLNKKAGLVLDVSGGKPVPGTALCIWPQNTPASPNQHWRLTGDAHLACGLQLNGASLVADVYNSEIAPGTPVTVFIRNTPATRNQVWTFIRDEPPVPVVTGQAVVLDGRGQWAEITPSPDFAADDFTVEAWVRTETGGPVLSTVTTAVNEIQNEGVVVAVQADSSLLFGMKESGSFAQMLTTTGPTAILDGEWHHVAAVRQGTKGQLYLDGVLVPPPAGNHDIVPAVPVQHAGQAMIKLGAAPRPVTSPLLPPNAFLLDSYLLEGSLDEVRLWSKARTDREIADDLHHVVSRTDPALAGRWSFDARNAADSSSYGRRGSFAGRPAFADSEVALVAAGEPYLVTQAKLTQDWIPDAAVPSGFREVSGYRVVLSLRGPVGSPQAGVLTLWAQQAVTLHMTDGTTVQLGGGDPASFTGITGTDVRTDVAGEVSFTIDAAGSLVCPLIKVRADFMAPDERLVVAPDRHLHTVLAEISGNALLGRDENGEVLPAVANGRRPVPLPPGTDPAVASAVAQAVSHVMRSVAGHSVQGDRPVTRSADVPVDFAVATPYVPRFQDVGFAPAGLNPVTDVIATHYLPRDQAVARVLVAEDNPVKHWSYQQTAGGFTQLDDGQVASLISGLDVTHCDNYTNLFDISAGLFTGARQLSMGRDQFIAAGAGELEFGWFGGDFFDNLASAAKILYTTVTTTVTDAVTKAVQEVETIVVTLITGIRDAATGLVKAFDAALQTVEEAAAFVGAMLARAGAEMQHILDMARDLFEWDDILVAQEVLARYLRQITPITKTFINSAGQKAAGAIERFTESVDADFDSWRRSLTGNTPGDRAAAARNSPPQDMRSSYLSSKLRAGLGQDSEGSDLDGYFGSTLTTLQTRLGPAFDRLFASLPNAIDTSGFFDALADPDKLLTAGLGLLLQAVQALTDLALSAAKLLVEAITALADALIDGVYALATARIDIPLVTPFVEQVVFKGRVRLTLVDLVALGGAIPLTVTYKSASGTDNPVFSKADHDTFLTLPASQYTWIRNPFAPHAPLAAAPGASGASSAGSDSGLEAASRAMIEPEFALLASDFPQLVQWGLSFIAGAAVDAWGAIAIVSDSLWSMEVVISGSSSIGSQTPPQVKFETPLNGYNLGLQFCYLQTTLPLATDFNDPGDKIAFGLWASQLIPFVSNAVASGKATKAWGNKGDPVVTGAYGVVSIAITAWLWWQRTQDPMNDPTDSTLEGMNNLFGSLSWAPQLLKAFPAQNLYSLGALLAIDLLSYPCVMGLTWANTIYDMVNWVHAGQT